MDGWRGTRLGYAGGRTGWLGNYANNDSLRGTRGLGQNAANQAINNPAVSNALRATDRTSYMVGIAGMIGALYFLASYRGKNKVLKAAQTVTAPVGQPAKKAIDGLTGN